jgi:hypothetical protein
MIAIKLKTMKNIILLITLTIASLNCKAQNTIKANELTINGHVIIGKNKSMLISNFGQPLEIEKDYNEMDEVDMYIYKYDGAVFYVMKNLIDSFSIIGSEYSFTKHDIKIGDNIQKLKYIFPLSFKEKSETYMSIHIEKYDVYVGFYIDNKTKKIKRIRIGSY